MPESQLPVYILASLFVGVLLVPALGLYRRTLAYPVALLSLLSYLFFATQGLAAVMESGAISYSMAGWSPPKGIELRVDMLSAFVVCVIATISVVVAVYARVAVRREIPEREVPFYSVMLIMLSGLTGIAMTGDLFNLYVFLEISSLSGYGLMAIGHRKAVVSAYRYLLIGTVGASFYLIGIGYLYVLTGSLNMADVAGRIAELDANPALIVSVAFIFVGVGLKMALFPMHLWLPDAYTYASSTATAIIAPVMTKVSAYVLIRMLFFIYDTELVTEKLPVTAVLTWLGLLGVVVGSIMAIAQTDAKRMLAYSSVAQVAYIAIGVGLANPLALIGAMLHILNHAAMKCCLFLVTGHVALQTHSTRISAYTGLGRKMPWTFFAFTVSALAMVGIPPTNGFFSKWYLVRGGIDAGDWIAVGIIVASGLLTAVYFFRLIVRIYSTPPEGVVVLDGSDRPWSMSLPTVAVACSLILLGLFNSWFVTEVLRKALPPTMHLSQF